MNDYSKYKTIQAYIKNVPGTNANYLIELIKQVGPEEAQALYERARGSDKVIDKEYDRDEIDSFKWILIDPTPQ